jgi:ferrous iron transport protein A
MMPLGLLNSGEKAEVMEVFPCKGSPGPRIPLDGDAPSAGRIADMGLRVGKVVEMLSNQGRGLILLRIDECRIAIGRGMAMKIKVRRTL